MGKLKPTSIEIYFNYHCPKCEVEHSVPVKEVREIGKRLCWCGYILDFAPMTSVDVSPNFGSLGFETFTVKIGGVKSVGGRVSSGNNRVLKYELKKLGIKGDEAGIIIDKLMNDGIV